MADYLSDQLPNENKGKYYVLTAQPYAPIDRGDVILFHKLRRFVGEARVKNALVEKSITRGRGQHKQKYQGWVEVDPKTIEVYKRPIQFGPIEEKIGRRFSSRAPYAVEQKVYELVARRK